ncbi:hypothetical protein [Agromyces binzhouensis]|uniref:hypothetical protein n=1 Tax=Agromyces binzhouensis TaxID=1817495 RepID=UPI00363823E3
MDPKPSARVRSRTGTALLGAIALTALLAGCTATGTPSPSEAPPATTPVPTASDMPPASDGPGAAVADRPLEAIDAYALCRAQTYAFYPGDFALLEYAPFDEASVLLRGDGLWFVYIEVDDGNRSADLVESGASNCIVGGTIGEPQWEVFGVVTRGDDAVDDYDAPLPSA